MRNPLSNSNAKSWMERTRSKCREVFEGLRTGVHGRKSPQAWVAVLLCVSLAGCISLVELARRGASKNQGKATIATAALAPVTQPDLTPAQLEKKAGKESSAETSKKAPREAKSAKAEAKSVKAAQAQEKEPSVTPVPLKPVVLVPPVDLDKAKEGEKEDSDISRKRQSWFFDQRAYPNKHIPTGAYQKALEQREAMRAQQRAAASSKSVADAVISFPGDALWHLMGPQPVNTPFGQNGGFPTASGRVTAIAVDPSDATGNTVYVGGAAGGVWKTTNGGTTWTVLTDTQPSLAVGSITIDPNSCSPGPCTTIYVGTGEENFNGDAFYGAGILKSTNGGTTWTQMGASTFAQALGPEIGGAFIGQIAVQPGNPNIVLAAVSYFANGTIGGIYRSTDAGNTWTEDAAPRGLGATSVFFESTSNAGTTATAWMAMGDPFPTVTGEAANGIYKSTDSGTTWTLQTSALPTANLGRITLGYAPSTSGSSATIYAAIADSSTTSSALLGLFKTTNGGSTWASVTGPAVTGGFCAQQCFYDMAIGVHPTNPSVVVLGGGPGGDNFTSVFESTNGGTSWTPASGAAGDFAFGSNSTHVHVDTHAIVFTASGATLYVGDDGGIWSTNTPQPAAGVSPTWTDLNAGLAITQFYPGTTAAVSDENYGFGGTQDNDTELFSGSLQWQNEFICGDGGFTAIDQNIPTTIWAACDAGAGAKVKKAVFNGQFVFLPPASQNIPGFDIAETAITNSGDAMQFIPPLALDDSNPNNLYFGTCRVWMSNNAESSLANSFIPLTPSWTPISGDLSAGNATVTTACPSPSGQGNITNIEVAHSNDEVIVAGTTNGKVWETTLGGANWAEIDAGGLPNRTVTAVRTKRSDSTGAIVYATFSGFDCGGTCGGTTTAGHVFKTTTAGSTNTWVNITGDLPDIPVNDIIVDHEGNPTHDALYIATDVGVFSCSNPEAATPCANWTVIGDGLPNSPVLSLAMRQNSRILRAATHGRSVWQIQLTDVFPPALAAISSVTPAAVNAVTSTTGSTSITVTGLNFSANSKVQFSGTTTGVTTTFVNTTQLNVSLSNSLLQFGGVYPITLTDSQGVDSGSALGTGGLPFTVMNPLLNPVSMTPTTAMAYTAVPFQFTAVAGEPFLQNSVIAFYNDPPVTNPPTVPTLQFQLPVSEVPTLSNGGTVYKLTTAITDFTTPGTYQVIPYNPEPGGSIDALALAAAAGGPVPFTFTVTANPGPVIQVSSPLELAVNAVGANSGTTYNFFEVSNLVGATLNITAASITGTNAANFKFIAPGATPSCNFESTATVSVAAQGVCFFGLEYTAGTPPGNANSVATLNITDNASGSPQAFPITGVILPVSSGFVFLSSVPFGPVAIGSTGPTMNATLTNAGTSPVNVTSGFSISGTNQADFHIVPFVSNGDPNPACPSTLPFTLPVSPTPGFACDVTLTFTPSLPASAETAQLNVTASITVTTATPNLTGIGIEITSISPSIVATGGPAFTLTVNGGGFASSAVVNVNGNARLTTFVNANQLLASIPATDIATAGSLAITVTTPVPGGTTSEPKTLVVAQSTPATNDNVNFAAHAKAGGTDLRTASAPYAGGSTAVTLNWNPAFPDTNYTAVCTVETAPSDFLLPIITLRSPGSMTVVPTSGGSPSGTLSCVAIPDSDTSDIGHGRVAFSAAPASVTVNWNAAFANTNYTAVCTAETQGATGGGFSSVISALTTTSVTVINGGLTTGTMHCIAVPDSDGSVVRHGRAAFTSSQSTVGVQWDASFADLNYATVCSDVQLGATGSDAAIAVFAGSRTTGSITVINEVTSGTVHCLAIPNASSVPFRMIEDTTQATTQATAFTGNPATPIDPTPCATGSRAKSVWFEFTAPASGKAVADTRFSSYATNLSAWTISTALPSSTASFAPVACNAGNVSGTIPQSLITFSVTGGTTYYLMVTDAGSGTGGTLTFSLDFASTAPANDDNITSGATGPAVISPAGLPYSNTENTILATANTNGHTDPVPPCASGAASSGQANSVWYEFTPTGNGTITADTLTSPYETILNVTSGTPTGTQVACNVSAATGIAQSQVSFAATSGTTYFFMVSAFLGDGGTTNFHLKLTAGAAGVPATITATSGTPQSAAVNTAFAAPLVATVLDSFSSPVSGANVTFTAPGSGASGKFSNNTATITVATNASGVASVPFTATATAGGPYAVTATVSGVATPANFLLTNTAGAAASMTANAGTTPQSATINTAFANALAVTVKDAGSNPVSGVNVTFTAPGSGASGKFSNNTATITVATNALGVASAPFTANGTTGGPYTVTAAATGLTTVNFSLTNTAGAASSMTANAGTTPQSATINTAFANALAVTVTDAGSNPISGVNVTFTAPGSGASGKFSNNTATITVATNASGVASAPFTANATAGGPYTVTASATGLATVNFALTNTAGAASSMTANAGTTPQSATINTAFANALAVTVKDAVSNPVSGVNVTFTAPGSGASGKFSNNTATITVATNASGVASAPFTANSTAGGPYTVTAAATGLTTVNFSLTNTAGAASSMTANAGTTPQSAAINTAFANALAVTVTDTGSNPISGVNVTFTAPGSGASGKFSNNTATITVATNASGVASAPFTANSTAGGPYTVTAAATGLTTVNFSLTNTSAAASSMTANAGTTPQSATINTAFANALAVTVKDAGSNPVSGVNVTFTAPGSGASGKFSNNTATITVATNASGVASAPFTANGTAGGPYTVTAAATGLTTVNFSLTNTAGAASSMTPNAGTTPQSAAINTAFANALAVTVTDTGSNPISGVNVTFTAPGSGASGKFSNNTATITVATNASGVASAPFTANATAGGPYTVTAAATGLATVNFALTNTAGAASSMTANAGTTPQSATINTAFANPLAVTVKDAGSNPVSGVSVTFTAPGSGASGKFSNNTATITVATNASGVASAPLTANATAGGPYNVTAAATGLTTVNFALTNLTGAAGSMTANAGTTPQSAAITTAFANALAVTVKDAGSNPVPGVNVTFTAPGSGASGVFSNSTATITVTTNASGVASAPFTANATAGGPYSVTAAATGLATLNFSLTNTAGAASSMTANAGTTPQSAAINTAFANPLAVTVKDAGSNPVSGVNVTFTAPGAGASGKFSNSTATITVATNALGVASAPFTANATAGGPYAVTAAATGLTTVNFSLTNTAGAASSMTANAGTTPQSATVSTAFANALAVTVKDASNNPIAGVNVTFTAPSSGASGKFSNNTTTITVATNASGVASAPFTANATAGGPYTVTAAATGLATVNFSLTNNAGAAVLMTVNAGSTPQSAAVNTAFADALAVTVNDSGNNPVSGVNVTFTAPGAGASGKFSNSTATITVATNASGVASAPFTANATAGGPYAVTAAATGLTTVNFSLTNTAGAASSMTANAGTTPQSATVSTAFANALAVTVKDASSNPIAGVNVTFTAPGTGASGVFSNNTGTINLATNASGVASAPFTANATAGGPYTVTATAAGVSTVSFSLTNNAGTPASMTANAGTTPQSATINTAFANQLAVTVKDAGSNPVSGVNVTFTAPGSGASGMFSNNTATITVATSASGVASVPFTANSAVGGPYSVTAASSGLTTVNFSLTNNAGPAASIAATAGTPQNAAINTAFATLLQATVKDAGSNPVSGVVVTFTPPASGASGTFAGGVTTATTNASGVATAAIFTANATAGSYTVTAKVPGVANPANFSLTNNPGPPASITATAGTPQTSPVNAAFTTQLQATVKDAANNLVSGAVVTFAAPASGASGAFAGGVNTATTNASGVATAAVFTANGTAGTYTVTAKVTGVAAPANFTLTNNNLQPTLASLLPASTLAGGAAFSLTINGNGFVNGATVSFGADAAIVPTSTSATQIKVTIPATDIAKAGQVLVIVTNPPPSVGPSLAQTFTVDNPVPTLTTLGQTHAPGGTAFTLTVNGTNFVATSVVNFGTKAEPTTLVSPTQVTAAIPAADVATAGPVNVTVVNPSPGGGPTPTSIAFTVDGFTLAGPGSAVTVKAGATATIPITITPTTNGFPNQVTFSVTGLPAHATLTPLMATPGNAKSTVNLMIVTTSRSAAPPASPMDQPITPMFRLLLVSWIATLLAGLYVALLIRRTPRLGRYAAVVPLALLIVSGVVLAGCASAMHGTPAGTSQLTVTATSGTLSQSTQATLTVQ